MEALQYTALTFLFLITGLVILLLFELKNFSKELKATSKKNDEGDRLKLQALERLTLYAERSGLKNLVERIINLNMSAADFHYALTENLKAEYEYNLSQQIYITPEVWHAITRLKDQNIYIVNHITSNLPPEATATDLAKLIIEYSMTPNAEMNVLVLDALQFEAKKILN